MITRPKLHRRARRTPYFEFLEERTLLSATATHFTNPDVSAQMSAYDSDGNLWVVNFASPTGHLTLDEMTNGTVTDSIVIDPSDNTSPVNIAAGANDHIWIADSNGGQPGGGPTVAGLDDVDTLAHTVTRHMFVTDVSTQFADVPLQLTVASSGNVWFTGSASEGASNVNVVGRYNPVAGTVSYLTLDSSTGDAAATSISANGADGAWVGMPGIDFGDHVGANHLVDVSFSGSISASYYAVHTLNSVADAATADAGNSITGVASDGTGGVWFSLANTTDTTAPHGADRIVHGVLSGGNLNQTAYILTGATVGNPQTIGGVVLDSTGKLWFNELSGNAAGTFDTATNTFSEPIPYPDGVVNVGAIVVAPAANQAAFVDFDDGSYVQIDVAAGTSFSGTPINLSGQEGTTFNNVRIANFLAPPPGPGGYSANIAWSDGTSSVGQVTYNATTNSYSVAISGKSFASQGTYTGTIAITDSANNPIGSLTLQAVITDTPLNLTSFNTTPLILRIAAATATFTDDPGRAASSFTATINWGDGTTSNGLIVADPTQAGRYIVIALHQYRRKGTYTATITINTSEALALINVNTLHSTVTV